MDNYDFSQKLANILSKARYMEGKSQEFMALSLGISKGTCINWEKGISSPTLKQTLQWFEVLGINFHKPLMELIYPDFYQNITPTDSDEKILEALVNFIEILPVEGQRELAYILIGEHGSDPTSLLQLFTAYLHLPLQLRVSIARNIYESYIISESQNQLVCTDHIMPNAELLDKAINNGKNAAIRGLKGYSSINE